MTVIPPQIPGSLDETSDVLLYGEVRPTPSAFQGHAGPLSFVFENGMLKHLRFGCIEIARRIYFAVRDTEWRTVPSEISQVQIEAPSEAFRATWSGRCESAEVDYLWQGEIEILSSGLIHFKARGKALKTFSTPRIGLCLLLSTDSTLEKAFEVAYLDGQTEQLRFNSIFKRTQLACRWTTLKFSPEVGVNAEYRIEGSHFDLEDQRNFGDVSCKAMAGMPYRDRKALAGLEYEQVLTVQVNSERPRIEFSNSNSPDAVQLRCMTSQISGRLPQLGVSLGDLDISPVSDAIPLIAELKGVLHFPLDCLSPKLKTQAESAGSIALQTERPVYLTLRNLSDEIVPELVSLLCQWVKQGVVIQQLDILDGTHPGLTWLRACAREARLSVPCGKVVASFKDRAGLLEAANSGADFLAWRGTPLSHQEDDETLLENADVFLFQAMTARCFAPQAQLTVGPIRFDRTQRDSRLLPDPRYRGILAAAFVASSLQALAEGQVDLAVFFDAIGPTGHVYASSASPQPGFDGNPHPQVFPSYYVLRELRSFAGSETFQVQSSDRLRVKAFGVRHRNGWIIVLINQTSEVQHVLLGGLCEKGSVVRIGSLDEATFPKLRTVLDFNPPAMPEIQKSLETHSIELVILAFSVTILREKK